MGLMDIVNGVLNGPRGHRQPSPREGSGGMSPMMRASCALPMARNPFSAASSGGATAAPASGPSRSSTARRYCDRGGPVRWAGGHPGRPLGRADRWCRFGLQLAGYDERRTRRPPRRRNCRRRAEWRSRQPDEGVPGPWIRRCRPVLIGTGPNQAIAPNDLKNALGSDTLDTVAQQTGMSRSTCWRV